LAPIHQAFHAPASRLVIVLPQRVPRLSAHFDRKCGRLSPVHTHPQRHGPDGEYMSNRPSRSTASPRRYYGKYRGLVLANIDPLQIGRIIAQVPDVLGEKRSSWAMPCVPAAGVQAGCFIVPPIGSQVWIEFEKGDPDYPIWTGGFWSLAADVPKFAAAPSAIPPGQNIVLQTSGQNALILSDSPPTPASGGIVLKDASGAMIVINETGIYISNGKGAIITMVGPTISVNGTALATV
jgi:Type VI secretion system/phage-baseplate injector OB domain